MGGRRLASPLSRGEDGRVTARREISFVDGREDGWAGEDRPVLWSMRRPLRVIQKIVGREKVCAEKRMGHIRGPRETVIMRWP